MGLFFRRKRPIMLGAKPRRQGRARARMLVRRGLLVVALVGIVAASMRHEVVESRVRVTLVEAEQIQAAADLFRRDYGRCPYDVDELAHPPAGESPYVPRLPRDPWGRQYHLRCPGRWDAATVDVASKGPDGAWLGGDDITTDL